MENNVIKSGLKNMFFVVSAQSVSLLLGIARTLILPILLGVTSFGYWQVYLLYISYAGVLAFGFNDGIYLKYGKYEYDKLPKEKFRSSIRLFVLLQIIITITISVLIIFESDVSKQAAILWAIINIPVAGLTGVLINVLQITNQLKKYSFYTILDKIIVLLLILLVFLLKSNNFLLIVLIDTLSKVIVLAMMTYDCRDIIFGKGIDRKHAFRELTDNVAVGIKLMLANFAGMLVLGFGRILIERTANVETYGIYSFAISTMNLILILITAIGLVIYPTFNRIDNKNYPNYFTLLNKAIVVIIFGLLVMIFPLKIFISVFMTDYLKIFDYLSIIFAIIYVQSKMQILINSYYKLLRKESMMLRANLIGIVMAVIIILPLYMITRSVTMVALGTLIAMLIRLYLSEVYLKKVQGIDGNKNIILEVTGISLFIILGMLDNVYVGLIGYLLIYSLFFIKEFDYIKGLIKYVIRR